MKCQSCGCDVPPAFVHAIKQNICAGCGGSIMDESSVELMSGLATAMEKMEYDPQGIAGWLLSNYRLEKVGDGEPTGFHKIRTISSKGVVEDYSTDKVKKLESFFQRANAPMDVVGAKKEDLKKKYQKAQEENEIIEDEDDEGFSQEEEGDETSSFDNNDSGILTEEMVEQIQRKAGNKRVKTPLMPEEYADLNDADPQVRAYKQKQLDKIRQARENVTSGVRTNINGFSRG